MKIINDKQKATTLIYASNIGTTGYTITQPGTYQLAQDVEFNPANPIGMANVTLSGGGAVTQATAMALVSSGIVRQIVVTAQGSGQESQEPLSP